MSSSKRRCLNNPDHFCYICGEYAFKDCRKVISDLMKNTYFEYFGILLDKNEKSWAPNCVCKSCVEYLRLWKSGKRSAFKFESPTIWREPQNHLEDCYFCSVNINGLNTKNRAKWQYPSTSCVQRPVQRSPNFSVSKKISEPLEQDTEEGASSSQYDADFEVMSNEPKCFSQNELDDLVRDLNLSKQASELLASRLKEKNLLLSDTKISFYRERDKELRRYFAEENGITFCSDIKNLLIKMGLKQYKSNDWRLFIDSSKRSLKCILLHNGNKYAGVPIAHSTKLKEEYSNISLVLDKIKYNDYKWQICVDLKMVNILLGQQSGYTKFPCFICLWDSRAKQEHWVRKKWDLRENIEPGKQNIIHNALVARDKIILPPLHIKLGIMKQFVKSLDRDGSCFTYICQKFPQLTMEKIKAGIFDGPQIRQLTKDSQFKNSMTELELKAWTAFVSVMQNFLGNKKSENYIELVEDLLLQLKNMGCNMSIKLHFLHSHLDRFPENLGDMSEEQGERMHQDLRVMEERYQGFWDTNMMSDYCWSLIRHFPRSTHKRRALKRSFLELND